MRARLLYAVYLALSVVLILISAEFLSGFLLAQKKRNTDEQYLLVLDPHLGFGYTEQKSPLKKLIKAIETRGAKVDHGFITFGSKTADASASRPTILIMGGSTTDPLYSPDGRLLTSWPEFLSEILHQKGKAGTVVTGAVSGFNSSQETFKFVRDGLEFKPDIVISYGGLRENEKNEPLPYPMVHIYQRYVLNYIVDKLANITQSAPLMKNTVALLTGASAPLYEATFGLPSKNTHAEAWLRNMRVMSAVATTFGAKFCSILQPIAFDRKTDQSQPSDPERAAFEASTAALREEERGLIAQYPYFLDLTDLFGKSGQNVGVLTPDGVHATEAGNKLVAEAVYEQLFETGKCL